MIIAPKPMPKRLYTRSMIEIELFPFLSVLVCTIGVLILLIIVLMAQTFSNQRQITIVAKSENGQNQNKQPRYIECRSDGIILYPSEEFVALSEINSYASPLQALLQEVKANRDQQYLIVAIRPDGIKVFDQVRELIESKGIDIGYEPIDEGWKLKIQTQP
jgi:biopolymer transport protein ExbD